ncbi:General transcription factor II-I repeat domain-containing protein 2 [Dictyocoela muelleri]|nr:General transcription factor II-I repeat domain-containing protein 2 [Dictyocoela muelleri]
MDKKRKVDMEKRQFQDSWTEEYYFVLNNGVPVCLLCKESIAVNKEYNLRRHFSSKHPDRNKFTSKYRRDEIEKLKKDLCSQQQMFSNIRSQHYNTVKASFLICQKIAKYSKSFSEGEFIKECLLDVSSLICPDKKKNWKIFVYRDVLLFEE